MAPIARVGGMAQKVDKRQIENGPRSGERTVVEVEIHSLSSLEFDTDAIGPMTISFTSWDIHTLRPEICGVEGTICISDADPTHDIIDFHGPVWYRTKNESRWENQPRPKDWPADWLVAENLLGFNNNTRGLCLFELALAVQDGRVPWSTGALSNHVLGIMLSIMKAPVKGGFVDIRSRCERPIPLRENFPKDRK